MMFYGFRAAILLLFGSSSDRESRANQSSKPFIQVSNRPATVGGEGEILSHPKMNAADRMAS